LGPTGIRRAAEANSRDLTYDLTLAAGASIDEVVGTLVAVAPMIGLAVWSPRRPSWHCSPLGDRVPSPERESICSVPPMAATRSARWSERRKAC
jgi:hypothetical protein